jgi:multidrug efflux pump subunit AcrA (membrane-fusion protein)
MAKAGLAFGRNSSGFLLRMPILDVMPDPSLISPEPSAAGWSQLEELVERLHLAARRESAPREFYQRLLADACSAAGAIGGSAWGNRGGERLELIVVFAPDDVAPVEREPLRPSLAERREAVVHGLASRSSYELQHGGQFASLVAPIADAATESPARPIGAIELLFRPGASAELQRGRRELAATLAAIAADFHALAELRKLRASAAVQRQAVDLLRRVQQPRDLAGAAFALANEARRLLACDRVAVLTRRPSRWQLLCASGTSRVDRRSEFASIAERLAEHVANWGEPIAYDGDRTETAELPPRLAEALAEHLDRSHARQLAAAPVSFNPVIDEAAAASVDEGTTASPAHQFDLVLIAERFDGGGEEEWRQQLIEIGELTAPVLARAAALDQFPVRTLLQWSERASALRSPQRRRRALWIALGAAASVAALTLVPATLSVEAPATLAATVEREIFASANGSIAAVNVEHGQFVKQGDVLIELYDPELSLKLQQVRGEVAAARQRLDAIAVTRTDRALAEQETEDRLPLSAEQQQLEERLATLRAQESLLAQRHGALTLRSPIDGEVLTPDVQSLLSSRPVERGESLLTIADVSSGWELKADVPQRDVGAVVEAETMAAASDPPGVVEASFRLSGDVTRTYSARVIRVSAAAPLEAEGLEDEAPPVQVRLAVDGPAPIAARPGMAAKVRIDCGRRSLGYVWFHDIAATLYRWITF